MAQAQSAGDSPEPDEKGGTPDNPEAWGNNGLVGEGRYRLTRRLGRGGMAEVFAAEDLRLGRTVAVKLLRSDLAEDPVSKARFTREAQSVAALNHHAVVAVYDSGEDVTPGGTVPYIVMELVEGRTIRDLLLNAQTPPPDQALIIVSGVLEALAYSHQHGIVHRDIKPANVIITHDGAVKVMDFGIARALDGAQNTMTQTGTVMGTPQYLSPEQALGKPIDTRSDLYAVGCLLYELLTGRPPFVGETPLSVVYQHVQDEPRLPSQVSDTVPPELDGLVMRSLAKDPDDRFQSAEEMRALVQYSLRMLGEQGGHTGGLWNTGPASTSSTPPMGTATPARGMADTAAMGPPMVMGRPGDDPGEQDGAGGAGRRGGVGKALVALVVAALLAGGGFLLLQATQDSGGEQKTPSQHSTSTPTEQETGDTDQEEQTDQPDFPPQQEPTWDGPSASPSESASDVPPEESPTSRPTETDDTGTGPGPGDTTGGSDDPEETVGGGGDEGTTSGTTSGGVSGGGDEGTTSGGGDEGASIGGDTLGNTVGGQTGG